MEEELMFGYDGLGVVGEDNAVSAFLEGRFELYGRNSSMGYIQASRLVERAWVG